MSSNKIYNIVHESSWNGFYTTLSNVIQHKKGDNNTRFTHGVLLADSKADFRVRELKTNSAFGEVSATALITSKEIFNFLQDALFFDKFDHAPMNKYRHSNELLEVFDMLWVMVEEDAKGFQYLGGHKLKKRETPLRWRYREFMPNDLLSKRYSTLYPPKKWLRERLEAQRDGYRDIEEELKVQYEEFTPKDILSTMRESMNLPEGITNDNVLRAEFLYLRNEMEKKYA